MKKHKFNIFPEMNEEEFSGLKESIRSRSFDNNFPVIIYQDAILDGWNRYRAIKELGLENDFLESRFGSVEEFEGTDIEAINYVMKTNERRNLTSSQRACVAVEADEIIEAIRENIEKERREKISDYRKTGETVQQIAPSKSNEIIADKFKTNKEYVRQAEKLKQEKPEQYEKVKSGEKTLTEIKKEEKKEQLESKKEQYEKKVEMRKEQKQDSKIDIFQTDKKFRIIYADPPWSYGDKQNIPNLGGAEKHYNNMSIKELCEMPINQIIEKDAVLFMWVTSPLLEECFDVIKAWGFKYKSSFIWDKVAHNMGHYNSVRHELLLICTKGSCTPDNIKLYDSVQSIEKTDKHSEKPVEFMNIIDDLYTHGDRIELFCRESKKENWFAWGNEI